MKQFTLLMLLTFISLSLIVPVIFADDTKNDKEQLKELQKDIENDLNDLEDDLGDVQDDFDDIEEKKREAIEDSIEDIHDVEDDLKDDIDGLREDLSETKEELKEDIEDAKEDIRDQLEDIKEENENGGGAFMFTTRLLWHDTDPLKDLNETDPGLKGKVFDFSNRKMMMIGFNGYYDVDRGLRIGGGLWTGYKRYKSDTYTGMYTDSLGDTTYNDSIVNLRVIPAYCGFICEKAFLFPNFSLFAGFMLGGGATILIKNSEASDIGSVFIDETDSSSNKYSAAVAPALAWDIHAGMAFTLSPHFHLGIDWVLLFAYAYEGFGKGSSGSSTNDFLSISPGLRLRIVIGKEG